MMRALTLSLALVTVAGWCGAAEFADFPEFRYMSGLPGGGFGVDSAGGIGFAGAVQMNIPVGYTPGAGNYALTGHGAAIDGGFPTTFDGEDVNGTAMYGFGVTLRGHGLWIGNMETGKKLESSYNVQVEVCREKGRRPGISLGVVDLYGRRSSRLDDPDLTDSRSFFAAATRRIGSDEHPAWITLGLGDGRFNDRLFGGVCYQAAERLKVLAEYDGWNVNAGAAYDLGGGWHDDEWHAVLLAGVVDLDRCTVGLSITRTGIGD